MQKSKKSKNRGIYFKKSVVNFGAVEIGDCGSAKLQLCNSYDRAVTLRVTEPSMPFICTHKKVRVKGRSYVNIPVKVVPVNGSVCEEMLRVKVVEEGDDGVVEEECVVLMKVMG